MDIICIIDKVTFKCDYVKSRQIELGGTRSILSKHTGMSLFGKTIYMFKERSHTTN